MREGVVTREMTEANVSDSSGFDWGCFSLEFYAVVPRSRAGARCIQSIGALFANESNKNLRVCFCL